MYGFPVDSVGAGPEPGGGRSAEPPPHPRLRRLYALGGAAARTTESLARALAALERIAREPEGGALLDDVGGALLDTPELATLFAGVLGDGAGADERVEPEEAARAGRGGARPPAGSLERPTRPARLRGAAPGGRRRAHTTPGHSNADASRALLERASAAFAAAPRLGLPDAVDAPVDGTKAPRMPRPVRHSGPATSPLSSAARVLDAAEGLRRRAERAGAPGAADTPVAMSQGAAAAPIATTGVNPPAQPANAGRTESPEGGSAVLIVRALQRLSAAPASSRHSGSAPADGSALRPPVRGGAATVDIGAGGDRARSQAAPASAPASGLRRLLAFRNDAELPPDSVRGPAPTPAVPSPAGVVEARLREAELAESLDRLLRREARRQGIDLDGGV